MIFFEELSIEDTVVRYRAVPDGLSDAALPHSARTIFRSNFKIELPENYTTDRNNSTFFGEMSRLQATQSLQSTNRSRKKQKK